MSLLWSQLRDSLPRKAPATADEIAAATYRGPTITSRRAVLVGINEFTHESVSHIPSSVRNSQLFEDRFTKFGFDEVTTLSSAGKTPTRDAILSAITNARRASIAPREPNSACDLVVIFLSTHSYLANGLLHVVPSNYDPMDPSTHLSLDDIVMAGTLPHHRTVIIVDGVHAPSTRKCFPLARNATSMGRCNNLPPTVSLLCTPVDFEGSLTLKLLHALVDLGEMGLPMTPSLLISAVGASALLYPLQSSTHSIHMASQSPMMESANQHVSFLSAVSVASTVSEATIPSMLSRSMPLLKTNLVKDTIQPFVFALEGGDGKYRGPVADFETHANELNLLCERQNLPRITLHKSFYGRLYLSIPMSQFADVRSCFHRKMVFGVKETAPTIQYFGVVYRVELTGTYRDYLLCDALARLHISEVDTRLRFEEVGPCHPARVQPPPPPPQQQQQQYTPTSASVADSSPVPLSIQVERSIEKVNTAFLQQQQLQALAASNTNNNVQSPQPASTYQPNVIAQGLQLQTIQDRIQTLEARMTQSSDDTALRELYAHVQEMDSMVRELNERMALQRTSEDSAQNLRKSVLSQIDDIKLRMTSEADSRMNVLIATLDDHERQLARMADQTARDKADSETLRRTLKDEQTRVREDLLQLILRMDKLQQQNTQLSPARAHLEEAQRRNEIDRIVEDKRTADRQAFEEKLHRRCHSIEDTVSRDFQELTRRLDALEHDSQVAGQLVPQQVQRSMGQLQQLQEHIQTLVTSQDMLKADLEAIHKAMAHKRPENFEDSEAVRGVVTQIVQQVTAKAVQEESHRSQGQLGTLQRQVDALSARLDKDLRTISTSAATGGKDIAAATSALESSLQDVQRKLNLLETQFKERVQSDNMVRAEVARLSRDVSPANSASGNDLSGGKNPLAKLTELATVLNELRSQVHQIQVDVVDLRSQQEHFITQREKDTINLTTFVQTSMQELLVHQNKKIADLEKRLDYCVSEVKNETVNDTARRVHEVESRVSNIGQLQNVEGTKMLQRLGELEKRIQQVGSQAPDFTTIDHKLENVKAQCQGELSAMERTLIDVSNEMKEQMTKVKEMVEGQSSAEDLQDLRYKLDSQRGEMEKTGKVIKDARNQIDQLSLDVAKLQGFVAAEAATSGKLTDIDERLSKCEMGVSRLEKRK